MRKYVKHELEAIVIQSKSLADVLRNLNIIPAGGNYQTVNRKIREFEIDTSHFVKEWNKGKTFQPKRDLSYYYEFGKISSHKLRLRLLKEGVFEHRCCRCKNTEWLGQPIALELEHKDGNNANNRLENLTMLCPNCHAQTDTYRGKNKGKAYPVSA